MHKDCTFVAHDLIRVSMSHEYLRVLIRIFTRDHLANLCLQQQIAAQPKYASQLLWTCQAAQQCHSATLAEAAQHDAFGRNSLVDLLFDKGVEVVARAVDTGLIFSRLDRIEGFLVKRRLGELDGYRGSARFRTGGLRCRTSQAYACPCSAAVVSPDGHSYVRRASLPG